MTCRPSVSLLVTGLVLSSVANACESAVAPAEARRWGPVAAGLASAASSPGQPRGTQKRRHPRDTWLFLDGEPLGVVKHSELPPGLDPTMVTRGEPFPLFPLAEYLKRMGVDLQRIKEVHLIGGQRPAILAGPELVRVQDKLFFAFTRATSGRPRMDWPRERVEASTKVDLVRAIAVYQDRDPPRFDRKARVYRFGGGPPIEGIPYATDEEERRGVRVYRDGRLAAVIRRKNLPTSVVATGGRYGFRELLAALGVPTGDVVVAAFIDDEEEVLRLDRDPLGGELTLRLLEKKGGAADLHAPSLDAPVQVTAISLETSH